MLNRSAHRPAYYLQRLNLQRIKLATTAFLVALLTLPSCLNADTNIALTQENQSQWSVRGSQPLFERQQLDQLAALRWFAPEPVTLQQGESVELILQPNQALRLTDITPEHKAVLQFWQDNGSGLWISVQPQILFKRLEESDAGRDESNKKAGNKTTDQENWLFVAPPTEARLLRIQSVSQSGAIKLPLQLSEQRIYSLTGQLRFDAVDLSSGEFSSPSLKAQYLLDQQGRSLDFYQLPAGQILKLSPNKVAEAAVRTKEHSKNTDRYRLTIRPLWYSSAPKEPELEVVLKNAQGQILRWLPDKLVDEQWQISVPSSPLIGLPQQLELGGINTPFQVIGAQLQSNQALLIQLEQITQPFLNTGNQLSYLVNGRNAGYKDSASELGNRSANNRIRAEAINNREQETSLAIREQLLASSSGTAANALFPVAKNSPPQLREALLKQHTRYETLLPLNAGGNPTAQSWTALRTGLFPEPENAIAQPPENPLSTSTAQQQATQWQYLQGLKNIQFTQWRSAQSTEKSAFNLADKALLKGEILFELDQDNLEAGFLTQLKNLADYLQQHPDDLLTLSGHTDAFASDQYNQKLSRKRAEVIQQYLISLGVAKSRLQVHFSGESEHRTPNSRPEQRRLNRRVELWLHPKARNSQGDIVDVWLYPLPQRPADSRVRILVAQKHLSATEPVLINVQQDQTNPVQVQLNQALLAAAPDKVEIGLSLLAQHPTTGAGTEGQNSALFQNVLGISSSVERYQSVRSAEFELGKAAQELRVWLDQKATTAKQPEIALQIRNQRPFSLSPEWLLSVPDTQRWALFTNAVQQLKGTNQLPPLPSQLLQPNDWMLNHWYPVLRWLQDQRQQIRLGVVPKSSQTLAAIQLAPLNQRLKRLAQARQAEKNLNWLEALGHWHWLSYAASPKGRLMAERQHSRALLALGQKNNAEQQLKGLLLFGSQAEQDMAAQELKRLYQYTHDESGLIQLYVHHYFTEPSPERLVDLTDQLLVQGSDYYGLALALAVPHAVLVSRGQSLDWLLQTLYRQNHWQALAQLTTEPSTQYSKQKQAYWQGLLAQAQGDIPTALALWQSGDTKSQQLAHYFKQGLAIKDTGLKTVGQQQAWQQWWYRNPSYWIWREANQRVQSSAGAGLLQQLGNGDLSQVFILNAKHELKLDTKGGGSLLLEVRPLHADYKNTPVSGWLSLHQGQQHQVHPLFSRAPSVNFQLLGLAQDYQVGQLQQIKVNIGDQQQPLLLRTDGLPLLVRVKQAEPAVKLALLAQPNTEIPPAPTRLQAAYPEMNMPLSVQPVTLMTEELTAKQLKAAQQGDIGAAYQALTQLIWYSEQRPEQSDLWLSRANALRQQYPSEIDLASRAALFSGRWQWLPIDGVSRSAGMRFINRDSWPATSQSRRIQQSLLPPLLASEQLLDAGNQLNYHLDSSQSKGSGNYYELKLDLLPLRFYPAQELLVDVRLDGKLINQVRLNGSRNQLAIRPFIPKGVHRLSLQLSKSWRNQLVKAELLEVRNKQRLALFPEPDKARQFRVASWQEPILFRVQGPTLLKIERYSAEQLHTEYRAVATGWQTIRLLPAQGESQSNYRIYQQTTKAAEAASDAPILRSNALSLPMAQGLADPLLQQDKWRLVDQIKSDHQQGPTWSAYAQVDLLQSIIDPALAESQTFELGVERRHQYQDQHYSYYQLAGRRAIQSNNNNDLSLTAQAEWVMPWYSSDTDLKLSTDLAYQNQRYQLGISGIGRWQFELAPSIWQNWFEAELFYRHLSHQNGLDADFDPKVWSQYRADHSYGVRMSDQLSYRPWLDTQLQLRADLISNTDLSLDRMRWRSAFYHQAKTWQWGIGYYGEHSFVDDKRSTANTEHKLQLELDLDLWQSNWARWQLNGDVGLLWPNEQPYFSVRLSRHEANGRGLTDFFDQRFSALRSLNAPLIQNNQIAIEQPLENNYAD